MNNETILRVTGSGNTSITLPTGVENGTIKGVINAKSSGTLTVGPTAGSEGSGGQSVVTQNNIRYFTYYGGSWYAHQVIEP